MRKSIGAIFDTNRDRTQAEIVAEGDRAHADFVALIRSLPEDDLAQPGRFSDQEARSLAEQILGNGFEHPVFHYADVLSAPRRFDQRHAAVCRPRGRGCRLAGTIWQARYNLACFYALSGQIEPALSELREALRLRPDLIEWSKQDPDLAVLRAEPAYQALYQS